MYVGTWIPLPEGRLLAAKNGVLEKLSPIFDYVPGDRTPPPAPKHATAASSKPRAPRAPAQPRRQPVKAIPASPLNKGTKRSAAYAGMPDYDQMDRHSMVGVETPDDVTLVSEALDDYDQSQYTGGDHKRRRVQNIMSQADREHQLWAEELLDYFMLQDNPDDELPVAPLPPDSADLNRPIDDKGHTALHWAAAMGDIEVVKDLIRKGAAIDVPSENGETPLMRAVLFTNNYDRQNMDKLAGLLIRTVNMQSWFGSTVFHHIAGITQRKSKYQCARYYIDCILNKMANILSPDGIERILNLQDHNGDTAITIAARNGARKCVRSLIGRHADVSIPNNHGETADSLIVQLNRRRQERNGNGRQFSSSPFQTDGNNTSAMVGGSVQLNGLHASFALDPMLSQNIMNGISQSMDSLSSDVYKSEAALALTSAIMPALSNKSQALAMTLESEIAEKEAEKTEAESVVIARAQEIELLRRQCSELSEKDAAESKEQDDSRLQAELEELIQECEDLTREEEDGILTELIKREEEAQGDPPADDLLVDDEEEQVNEKMALARELHDLVQQRGSLIKVIVQALSVAGFGDKQAEYRRLITGALGVQEEDVESLLPEIVNELEDVA